MIVVTSEARAFIGERPVVERLNSLGRDDILVVDNLADSSKWQNPVKRKYADYIREGSLY